MHSVHFMVSLSTEFSLDIPLPCMRKSFRADRRDKMGAIYLK
jgi:hypothetical protein